MNLIESGIDLWKVLRFHEQRRVREGKNRLPVGFDRIRTSFLAVSIVICGFGFAGVIETGFIPSRMLCAQSPAQGKQTPSLDSRSRAILKGINDTVRKAGVEFQAGNYDESGQAVKKAVEQIGIAMGAASPELYDAMLPAMSRITNARAMLELEGISLPPFRRPERPSTMPAESDPAEPKPGTPMAGAPIFDVGGVSFVKQVAPILVSKCGNCHVTGSKGGFSAQSFAALMKGPPEGVVIFAGDTIGSRLIETIETGAMPKGNLKVNDSELATLKKWIMEGAKYDGTDPAQTLTSLAGGLAAPAAADTEMAMAGKPTGSETVSFASDVAPLLVKNCTGCHIDAMQTRGGLRMDTLAAMLRGSDSGNAIEPGKGEASLLVRKLRGTEGDRMPAGGRPPLSDSEIQLISTWIDEGATIEPVLAQRPLKVLSQQAWLAKANPDSVSAKRAELASNHYQLAGADTNRLTQHQSDHFALWGEVSEATLETIAKQAEAALGKAAMVLPGVDLDGKGDTASSVFNGRASIYVMPRRYDYSEFAKMVEGRGIPTDWQSHWHYDGIQSYVAMVASDRDEPDAITDRLIAPVVSLAVASRGADVPRWFADGLGRTVAARVSGSDRATKAKMQAELITAVGSLDSGKAFFKGSLPPDRADRLAAAVCDSFLSRERKRSFDAVIRSLGEGKPFDASFTSAMGMPPTAYFDAWLKWLK